MVHKLNLIPEDIKIQRKNLKRKKIFVITICTLFLLILFSSFYIDKQITNTDIKIAGLNKKLISYGYDEDLLKQKEFEKRIKICEKLENNTKWALFLEEIREKKPNEVFITNIETGQENTIIINGTALKNTYIVKLIESIEKIKNISSVKLKSVRYKQNSDNEFVYFFEIESSIKKD